MKSILKYSQLTCFTYHLLYGNNIDIVFSACLINIASDPGHFKQSICQLNKTNTINIMICNLAKQTGFKNQ